MFEAQKKQEEKAARDRDYADEVRYIHSDKQALKIKMQEKRRVME